MRADRAAVVLRGRTVAVVPLSAGGSVLEDDRIIRLAEAPVLPESGRATFQGIVRAAAVQAGGVHAVAARRGDVTSRAPGDGPP